jgi:hypothetical protein
MKLILTGLCFILFAVSSFSQDAGAETHHKTASLPTAHIEGHGCMKPGTVAGCYVVNDYKNRRKYNVFFSNPKPEVNTGISFEGIGFSKVDPHCNQGQKVQVASWKPLAGECPQRERPK